MTVILINYAISREPAIGFHMQGSFSCVVTLYNDKIHVQGFYGLRLTALDSAGTDLLCLTVDFELQLPSKAGADVNRIDQGRRVIAPV